MDAGDGSTAAPGGAGPPEPTGPIRPDARFGRYTLHESIRTDGTHIECFRASQHGLDREVEVRILKTPLMPGSPLGVRFVEQLRILASIDHPSVLPVLDAGIVSPFAYFVTPLRDGVPLAEHLRPRGGRVDADSVLAWVEILADALAYLHERGLLHRGINAQSVFFDRTKETVYISECNTMLDLAGADLSGQGFPQLSPLLTVPEGREGQPWTPRADIFLLGCLGYRMISGVDPVPPEAGSFFEQVRKGFPAIRPLETLTLAGIPPPGLVGAIVRAISPSPEGRQGSARELAEELKTVARKAQIRLAVRTDAEAPRGDGAPARPRTAAIPRVLPGAAPSPTPAASPAAPRLPGLLPGLGVVLGLGLVGTWLAWGPGTPVPGPGPKPPDPSYGPAPSKAPPLVAPPAPPGSLAEDKELAAMAAEVRKEATSKPSFEARWKALRRWVMARGSEGAPVATYAQVMALHLEATRGDAAAYKRLDEWLLAAAAR